MITAEFNLENAPPSRQTLAYWRGLSSFKSETILRDKLTLSLGLILCASFLVVSAITLWDVVGSGFSKQSLAGVVLVVLLSVLSCTLFQVRLDTGESFYPVFPVIYGLFLPLASAIVFVEGDAVHAVIVSIFIASTPLVWCLAARIKGLAGSSLDLVINGDSVYYTAGLTLYFDEETPDSTDYNQVQKWVATDQLTRDYRGKVAQQGRRFVHAELTMLRRYWESKLEADKAADNMVKRQALYDKDLPAVQHDVTLIGSKQELENPA